MRPMFKQGAVAFQQGFEVFGLVAGAAGKQDHVMGALNGSDAVDLHKTDAVDQLGKGGVIRLRRKRVAGEEDAPCDGIVQDGKMHVTGVSACLRRSSDDPLAWNRAFGATCGNIVQGLKAFRDPYSINSQCHCGLHCVAWARVTPCPGFVRCCGMCALPAFYDRS